MTALTKWLPGAAQTSAFRLSAAIVLAFILLAGLIAALLFWQTNTILTTQVLASLRAEAEVLARQGRENGPASLAETISLLSRSENGALYYLANPNGEKIAGNLSRVPPELSENLSGGVFSYAPALSRPTDPQRLAVAIPVDTGPGAKLLVGRDIDDQRAFADTIKRTVLIGFGTLTLLGLLGGLLFSRAILNRIESINATSRSIMAGDLSQRVPIEGTNDEIDDLSRNLNGMLERIENLMGGLREVSDNIAHDLKTPLNRLRNSAEAALRDPRGAPAYREGLEKTIEKADELIKTFNALLLIARLEAGPLQDSLSTFDLAEIVGDVAELYTPAAEEVGFALTNESVPGMIVHANRHLIGQAVANLIDNAIKYSRGGTPGSAITVRTARTTTGPEITVSDRGPGISSADRERALKRFVRLEESRTKPGTGLGLSLVSAVARLHDGSVRLEDNEPGLRVVLALSAKCLVQGHEPQAPSAQSLAAL